MVTRHFVGSGEGKTQLPALAGLETKLPTNQVWGAPFRRTAEICHVPPTWAAFDPKGTFRTQVASGKSVVTLITSTASSE